MNKTEIKVYSAETLKALIRSKYPAPAWVVLDELREATAWVGSHEADSVAFGTWPSRGFQIIGFEVKSYRGDWLSELKKPEKQVAIGSYCHHWWVVCSKDVAKLEEFPPNWGWLTPRGQGLHIEKQAVDLTPEPLNHAFLASIVRKIQKCYTPNTQVETEAKDKAEQIIRNAGSEIAHLRVRNEEMKIALGEFEKASGVNLEHPWQFTIKDIATVVRAIIDSDLTREISIAEKAAEKAQITLQSLKALQIMKAPQKVKL